jgi:hypothetical protein
MSYEAMRPSEKKRGIVITKEASAKITLPIEYSLSIFSVVSL